MATTGTDSQSNSGLKSIRPNHALDSTRLLRWSNKLLIDDVAVGGRVRRWPEHSPAVGKSWLRCSADSGDFYAMESLGLRLFNGDGLERSPEEGLAWLKKSAEVGNPIAMALLAECLVETESVFDVDGDAARWLLRSIEQGNRNAALSLGSRLIAGVGLTPDPERGERILQEAARNNSQLAHIKLGIYLLSGHGLRQDREEGLRWLRRVGATEANHMSLLAYHVYMKSLAAPTKGGARVLAEESAVLLQEAMRAGNDEEQINLGYLLRRGEIAAASHPSLDALLATYANRETPSALMNQALRLAKGVQCTADWHVADILVGKIRDSNALRSWWSARSEEGDAEGDLVIGWLVRHQLALDSEQMPLMQRMNLARDGGWPVPAWMNFPARAG